MRFLIVLAALTGAACGSSPTRPRDAVEFVDGPYRLTFSRSTLPQSGGCLILIAPGQPVSHTVIDVMVAAAGGAWQLRAASTPAGDLTAELGTASRGRVSGKMRGWALDRDGRRIVVAAPDGGDALLSGTATGATASGELVGEVYLDSFGTLSGCSPVEWSLAPR